MSKKRTVYSAKRKAEIAIEAIKESLTQAQLSSQHEIHPSQVKSWKQQALLAIEQCFTKQKEKSEKQQKKLLSDLYEQIGHLHAQLNWLKKNTKLSIEEKRTMLNVNHPSLALQKQCELLGLAHSSYYYTPAPLSPEKEQLMKLLDQHYTAYPFEGKIKRSKWLSAQVGYPIGARRIRSLMELMWLETLYPKPDTSAPNKAHLVYPYLLRELDITHPNQVWAADITYLPLQRGHVYLFAIIDWYSRYVVDWQVSASLEADFCVETLIHALGHCLCDIFNTDQGSQFTSHEWIKVLKEEHISISMDGRGCYFDNIFVERLWRSVKQECIYLHEFETIESIKVELERYFEYYNHQRMHQSLGYQTPASVYFLGKK